MQSLKTSRALIALEDISVISNQEPAVKAVKSQSVSKQLLASNKSNATSLRLNPVMTYLVPVQNVFSINSAPTLNNRRRRDYASPPLESLTQYFLFPIYN